jgi:WD40 repeat protein
LRVLRAHFGPVSDARFSPDGRWIVTAGPRSVGLWKASTGELVRLLDGPPGPYVAVAFTPNSRTIVALTEGGVVTRYRCRVCDGIPGLLELADERLDETGRTLTPQERELYD